MTGADERPDLGFAGCVHEAHLNEFRPAHPNSKHHDNPGNAGCLLNPRYRRAHPRVGRLAI
jgi:hypothetical protein